jgi:hypothetical protein
MSINISNATGTNNATNIYCNGHCNSGFSDIRFTLNGISGTSLPYWIESATGKVWVNVTANGTVNMYYGNSAATSVSSKSTTFPFSDQSTLTVWGTGSSYITLTNSTQTDATAMTRAIQILGLTLNGMDL